MLDLNIISFKASISKGLGDSVQVSLAKVYPSGLLQSKQGTHPNSKGTLETGPCKVLGHMAICPVAWEC